MTNKQTKEQFLIALNTNADLGMCEAADMVNAIKALEKQIPKKAEHEDGVWSICPCCGGSVCNDTEHAVNREVSYCEHCGQAIDWENSEFD